MHVLVTADTIGGVWTYTQELVCGLLDRGHRVTLVSFGRMPTSTQISWMRGKNLAYYPTAFPLEWMQDAQAGIAESVKYLEKLTAEVRPDILHSSQFCFGSLRCEIPKIVVAHSDVRSWWKSVHEQPPPQTSWFNWYTDLVSRGLSAADVVVAPSRWMLAAIRENYQLSTRSQVIHNGRNPDLFNPSQNKINCVLAVGRVWDEAKQIKLLLDRTHSVPVKIAGTATHPEHGHAFVIPSNRNVTFCGEQDEAGLRTLYSESAIYAATSRYEPFGLAPVEAALSGCALIANDIPSFRELWEDAALYFTHNNADSLADVIRTLSEDAPLRSEYGTRAYERARQRFTSHRMVAEYDDLYASLVARSAAA